MVCTEKEEYAKVKQGLTNTMNKILMKLAMTSQSSGDLQFFKVLSATKQKSALFKTSTCGYIPTSDQDNLTLTQLSNLLTNSLLFHKPENHYKAKSKPITC